MHEGLQQRDARAGADRAARAARAEAASPGDVTHAPGQALQRRQQALDASPRVNALHAQAATLQRRPAAPGGPVVQRLGFGALGGAITGLATKGWALAAANPWVSIPLGLLAVGGGLAYAYNRWSSGLARRPGQLDVADLPAQDLWRMYINPKDFGEAEESKDPSALYDNDKSPGFARGMRQALMEELTFSGGHLGRRVDFAEYTRLHDLVSSGLRSGRMGEMDTRETTRGLSAGENVYLSGGRTYTDATASQIPREADVMPLPPVNFPINDWNRDATPLAADLQTESIGGVPMVGGGGLNTSVVRSAGGRLDVNYGIDRGPVLTQQILDRYYDEVGTATTAPAKLRAIVKAIRAIHVTHVFRDANGRLNVNILLNKFLLEQGFNPTILPREGLGVFGGGFSLDQLADMVSAGSTEFRRRAEAKKTK